MIEIICASPYDLGLSVRAMWSFGAGRPAGGASGAEAGRDSFRTGVWLDGRATAVEVRQTVKEPAVVSVMSRPSAAAADLRRLVASVVNADMDLAPFYALAGEHGLLGPLIVEFRGLKPLRPAGLFDMLVMAVTEQQISLLAAQHIQSKLVKRFGAEIEGLPVFPSAQALAGAPLDALTQCGLSRRKAEYIRGVAQLVAGGILHLETLQYATNDEVREIVSGIRGFGRWSADYLLIRGLGRVDVVPFDDVGVRRVVGNALGGGRMLTPAELEQTLAPFAPYRGLATYYLLAASRRKVG